MGCSTYSIAVSSRKSSDFVDETHLAAVLIAPPIFKRGKTELRFRLPFSVFSICNPIKIHTSTNTSNSNDSSRPAHRAAHWRQPASDAPARR